MHAAVSNAPPLSHKMWLAALGRPYAHALRRSGLLLSTDAVAAIGFAAGLGFAVASLSYGLTRAAPWLFLAAVSAALRGLLAMASLQVGARAAHDIKGAARHRVVRAAMARPAGDRTTTGHAMSAVVEGVEALDGYFARFVPARTAATFAPILVLGAIAIASPISAGILLLAMLPFVAGMALAGMAAGEEARRQFQALERLSAIFLDRVRALPLILAFGAEADQTRVISDAAVDLQRRTARVLRVAFLSSAILEFFAALSVALVAVYCGFSLLGVLPFKTPETLNLGRAFFVLALAPEVYAPMRRLAAVYHDRQAAEAAAPALAMGNVEPVIAQPIAFIAAPAIHFRAVSIVYPDTDRPVFEGFDLMLEAGSTTALVGPTGSGKTTLLHLFLGLAPLTRGEVSVGDLRLSDVGSFAPAIAWAGQSPLIAPGSLAYNIALGRPGASRAEIEAVAARVELDEAASRRVDGLDALLDERGGGLSGGERRRVALARALLKNAPILLLDEPTANLDLAAEQRLLPLIAETAKGRTTLIATHSEAVAALADRVVRL